MIIISEKGHYLGEKNHRQKMIDHLQNAGNLSEISDKKKQRPLYALRGGEIGTKT